MSVSHLRIHHYLVAIITVVLTSVVMLLLNPIFSMTETPLMLFFGAVAVSAWYGGVTAGLLAACLSVFFCKYFFISPFYSLNLDFPNFVKLGLFFLQGTLISVLCEQLHCAKTKAEKSLRLLSITEGLLQKEKQHAVNILESITDGFFALDKEWRFTYINNRGLEILQRPIEEILGQCIWEVLGLRQDSFIEQNYRRAMAEQISISFEASIEKCSGRCYEIRIYPTPEGLAVYFLDITERKNTEDALRFSETRFANLVANIPGVIYQYREYPDGRCEFPFISSRCIDLWEVEAEQMQQNPRLVWESIHPQDLEPIKNSYNLPDITTGEQWQKEWRIIAPSGKIKWLQAHSRTERQPDGSVVWDAVVFDITERKLSESRFRHIFESNMIGMNFFTSNHKIIQANQAYLNIIGYTQEDLQTGSFNVQKITPPEYWALEEQAYQEICHHGVCTPYEKEYIRKDGSRIPVLIGAAGFDDGSDGGICFVLDLSERKKLENQLRQQTVALELAHRAKDEFLAILSHELRTPLNAILGFTQIIKNRKLSEEKLANTVEIIERNAQAQRQLIEDLLAISHILQGKLDLQVDSVNLVDTIQSAMSAVISSAEKKSINLELLVRPNCDSSNEKIFNQILEYSPLNFFENHKKSYQTTTVNAEYAVTENQQKTEFYEPQNNIVKKTALITSKPAPAVKQRNFELKHSVANSKFIVSGDSKRLYQVFYNLLDNAVKFTPKGGKIQVVIESFDSYVQIKVIDNGVGINPEFLPYVFELFCQADSSITRQFGGLGLGLAIVRHIIEMHGGNVRADSLGEGLGATFTVKLPYLLKSTGNRE